jgi:hypothetical protein
LNSEQGYWLKTEASMQGIHYSEYVRDLITLQMKEPHFLEYFKKISYKSFTTVSESKSLIYNLMAYKLLEQLVLNQEEGQQKREAAYTATLEWIERLKGYPTKTKYYRLSLLLEPEQVMWLKQQSKMLNKNITAIVRKIIILAYGQATEKAPSLVGNTALTEIQREEIKAILMTFTLLKMYIESTYEEGGKLVKSCYESAQRLYKKLDLA